MTTRRARVASLVTVLARSLAGSPVDVAAADDPILVGAGDIAVCGTTADTATGDLVEAVLDTEPTAVAFTLGDNAYDSGTRREFDRCYHPAWGSFKSRTRPSVGNHEYKTTDAAGYFGYFGSRAGTRRKAV